MVKVKVIEVEPGQYIRKCPIHDCDIQVFWPQNYCHNCGVRLDWSEVKEIHKNK